MTHGTRWAIRCLAAVLALAASCTALAQVTLWGATGANGTTSNLYTIDPATGAGTVVGPIGFAVTGLAVHPSTGVLYGSTTNNSAASPGSLITINKATGQGTLVGSFGASGQTHGRSHLHVGRHALRLARSRYRQPVHVNLATGAGTQVGTSGLDTFGSGLAANASNILYYAGDGNRGRFYTINRATGAPTQITATMSGGSSPDDSSISALAFSPGGVLYGVVLDTKPAAKPTVLVTINPANGVITDIVRASTSSMPSHSTARWRRLLRPTCPSRRCRLWCWDSSDCCWRQPGGSRCDDR